MTKEKLETKKSTINRLRLGFRLGSIYWPLDFAALGSILDKLGYKNIQTTATGSLNGTKPRVDFYSDRPKGVFGFYGDTTDALITAQREFFASTLKDFKADMNKFIKFYEFETILTYYTDIETKNLSEIFTNSKDLEDISKTIGEEIDSWKIDVVKKGASTQDLNWFRIEIEPKIESAGNGYHCRYLRRTDNLDEIIKILRKSSEVLEKLAQYVENKHR